MAEFVPLHEAKARLTALVKKAESGDDVVLTRHGRPVAVVMSVEQHAALMEQLDELEDRLAVHESDDVGISAEKLWAELGL